jgi:hypothetical protein
MDAKLETRVPATVRRLLLAGAIVLLLTGCQGADDSLNSQQMAWAKGALERNPNLEIVATDASAGVFTVRDKRTREIHAVKLDELAAAPVAQLTAVAPVREGQSASADADAESDAETAAHETTAAQDAAVDDYSTESPDSTTDTASVPPTSAAPGYTVERAGGRVKVSGPGVSIVSGDSAPVYTAKGEPGQRTVDPIICEGQRMMHFDGRDIYVDGDAITVRGGCELYITNSRIVASSTGVVVREGTVHIANSYVEGARASFDAEDAARLYLRGSTFQGVSRRDALAMIEDQGGNRGLPAL